MGVGLDQITVFASRLYPSLAPNLQRDWIIPESDADVFDHPIDLRLKFFDLCFIQWIIERQNPADMRRGYGCRFGSHPAYRTRSSRHGSLLVNLLRTVPSFFRLVFLENEYGLDRLHLCKDTVFYSRIPAC